MKKIVAVIDPALILIPEMLYVNEFPVCWFVLFWDVFTVPVNHP